MPIGIAVARSFGFDTTTGAAWISLGAASGFIEGTLMVHISDGILAISQMYGVEIETEWIDYTPAAEVSELAAEIAEKGILETVGEEGFAPAVITSGSDDFHFYTIHRPELKATMLGIGADLGPGLHHPDMTFNHEALDIGARVLATTLRKAFD